MSTFHLILITWIVEVCNSEPQHKFLKVHRITDLTSDQYAEIFKANYGDDDRTTAKHNIQLSDEFGRFMKLSYESKHALNTNIIKLDESFHSKHIESLACSFDEDQNNIIQLNFTSKPIAQQYYDEIQSSLFHPKKKHFITASNNWHCNSEAILKQITDIESNDAQLILHTKQATLLNMFETLHLSYETNVNHNPHPSAYIPREHHDHPRRLRNFWGTLWSDAVDGIREIIAFIRGLVIDMGVPTIMKTFIRKPIHYGPKHGKKSWSWNYGRGATKKLMFTETVSCEDCSVNLDLTYKYQLDVEYSKLQHLLLTLEGDIDITSGIGISGGTDMNQEYRVNTPQTPIFGFSVAGIAFNANLYGQFGAAVHGSVGDFSFVVGVSGSLKKGIEFQRNEFMNESGYHYINEHSLHFDKPHPKMNVEQAELHAYVRPALYLQLDPIGSFYFGVQPTYDFSLKIGESQDCWVYWTPKIKANVFIGASLDIVDWKKSLDFHTLQTDLNHLAGCIDKKDIIHNQDTPDVFVEPEAEAAARRRRMTADDVPSIDDGITYVDISNINVVPRFSMNDSKIYSEHWGNLSTIPALCNDFSRVCNGYITESVVPHHGNLLMSKSMANGSWIAIYRTQIAVTPKNHLFLNGSINTNVSCIARHRFDLMNNVTQNDAYANITYDAKLTYSVSLLEWYCDTEDIYLGLNKTLNPRHYAAWQCLISLPQTMTAIASDPSFATIMLFSAPDWCHVFTLNSKPHYILPAAALENWRLMHSMYTLWYGIWDCPHNDDKHARLYFISHNATTLEIEAILHYEHETRTLYLKGFMDLVQMEMKLKAVYWYEKQQFFDDMNTSLNFIGLLRILNDGSIIWSGSVQHKECTGFVFQGSVNLTKIEENLLVDESGTKDASWNMEMFIIIGCVITVVFCLIFTVYILWKRNKRITESYTLMGDSRL